MDDYQQMPPRRKRDGICSPPSSRSGILNRLERAVDRNVRRRLIGYDFQIVLELLALLPLPADERGDAHIRDRVQRPTLPGERTDDRIIFGLGDGLANSRRLELLGALEDVDRYFQVGEFEAERLGPLLAGRLLVRIAILLRGLAGQARLERM